jgi:uncharacterized membrane protein
MSVAVIVHRLASGIHLRGTGNSLFSMDCLTFRTVIYIIIAITMKTVSSAHQSWNISQISDRLILILAGITTAIICSMVFLHDTYSSERMSTTWGLGQHLKVSQTVLPVDVKKIDVVSAILLLR